MTGKCKLNNMNMRNLRKEKVYQCVIIDLYLLGIIEKDEAELVLGCGIPNGLCLPGETATGFAEDKVETPDTTDDDDLDETEEDEEDEE